MDNARLIHSTISRLKNLRLEKDEEENFKDYCSLFDRIMNVLESNELSIPRRLEDFLFDAGLPEGSKYFRNKHIHKVNSLNLPQKRKLTKDVVYIDFLEYHKAHGHASLEALRVKAKNEGFLLRNVKECENCTEHAFMLKFLNNPKPKATSNRIIQKFHCQLSPEYPQIGFTGVKNFLLIMDDFSKMMFIYTIRSREEVPKILIKFLVHCARFGQRNGYEIETIITEDSNEFYAFTFQNFLQKNRIKHIKIRSNETDEFVDYYSRSIQVMLKLLMNDAEGMDQSLWSEGIKAAVYIYNNLPDSELNWKTPCDIWQDKELVFAKRFYPFGKWFMASFEKLRTSARCRFVGYHPHDKNFFRFYNVKDETIGFGEICYEL